MPRMYLVGESHQLKLSRRFTPLKLSKVLNFSILIASQNILRLCLRSRFDQHCFCGLMQQYQLAGRLRY